MTDQIKFYMNVSLCFNLIVAGVGLVLNGLTLLVSTRKELRSRTTFVFIAFNSVIETIPLFNRNLDIFLIVNYFHLSRYANEILCMMNLFLHYFPLQTSAWLLIAITIDIYLSVKTHTWKSRFHSKHAVITASAIVLFFFSINFCLNFSPRFYSTYIAFMNKTTTFCDDGYLASTWTTFNLYVYSIIPFFILLIVNSWLIYKVWWKRGQHVVQSEMSVSTMKKWNLSILVILLTLKYVLFTAPVALSGGYFMNRILSLPYGSIVMNVLSVFRYLNHSLNFVILISTSRRFRKSFKNIYN